MTDVLVRRENRDTGRTHHVMTEAETEVTRLQAQELPRMASNHKKL